MQVSCRQKETLIKEKIRSLKWCMHGKAIWKPGIGEIAKASRGIASDPATNWQRGLQHLIWTPSSNGQQADVRWVMTYYAHETKFLMKNGGQTNAWIKPYSYIIAIYILYIYIYIYILLYIYIYIHKLYICIIYVTI